MGVSLIQQHQLRAFAGVCGCSRLTHFTSRPTRIVASLSTHRAIELSVEAELIIKQEQTTPTIGSHTT
jgi:hypothetical protein